MKERFNTILHAPHKWELIYWWVLRGAMIFALIDTLVNGRDYNGSNPPIQILANLVGMFAYEIIVLFFPKKSRLQYFSPRFQNITALGFFLGSFGGAYMNLYYILPMYDKILHALGTAEAVYIGYEYTCATQLKLKKTCPKQIATLCSFGFGFILSSAWELFEFAYDQFFSHFEGDCQHWNLQKAIDTVGGRVEDIFQMFPIHDMALFAQRFPLMDTMADIVMNFVGGIIMYVILCVIPYRHRGKGDINALIEREATAAAGQKETISA